jgi:aminoglycoside phosphotransferase (APT) family kinase protein
VNGSASGNEISVEQCQAVLSRAFLRLSIQSVMILGEGWDSIAFLVNRTLVFRLPKRTEVHGWLWREQMLLSAIADRLPLPVPRFVHISEPIPGFPFGVAGYRLIKGAPLSQFGDTWNAEHLIAIDLTSFLTSMHSIEPKTLPPPVWVAVTPESWWMDRLRLFERARPHIESGSRNQRPSNSSARGGMRSTPLSRPVLFHAWSTTIWRRNTYS